MEQKQLGLFGESKTQEARNIDSTTQIFHFLALSTIRGIGFQTLRRIYERYGRFDSVWSFSDMELHQFASKLSRNELTKIIDTLRSKQSALTEKAENTYESYKNRNINIIFQFESNFPKKLFEIPDPPYWLFIEGNRKLLSQENLIAIVGNRSASHNGINAARKISSILSENGLPIVSGLAEGIDAVAQQTAVDYGNQCVAVLGTGISVVFPSSTASLRSKIVKSDGAVITEYLPNDSYSKSRFILRNRIQVAISRIIIPVEWSAKGGTAHTVRYAEKYGKPVVFVRGLQDHALETNSNLYTSISNRYFIDVNSKAIKDEISDILTNLHIEVTPIKKSLRESKDMFRSVIDEFNRLIDSYDVDESDFKKLIANLEDTWMNRKNINDH